MAPGRGGEGRCQILEAVLREPRERAEAGTGSGFRDGGKEGQKMGDAGEKGQVQRPEGRKSLDQRLREKETREGSKEMSGRAVKGGDEA